MSEMILAEQGAASGNGGRKPILFYVPKGATEKRVHGVLHRRTDRRLRDGVAIFEAVEEPTVSEEER